MNEMKKTLFEFCKFYEDTGNRMYYVGNKGLAQQFFDMRDGVMGVISSLKLENEYDTWKDMKECEK